MYNNIVSIIHQSFYYERKKQMELKLKTQELQDMVGKAIKCVSNNKLIPLTSLMNIKVKNHVLTITTTDATNYFYVRSFDAPCDDFEVSVIADLFTKLVQKTTADTITLQVVDRVLKVMGNGTYTMELPLDENGSVIKFPKKYESTDFMEDPTTIKLSTIKTILASNKASLAISVELPSLTCYYCGDKVVTSDSYKICSTDIKAFNKPTLISAPLMELLGVMDKEDISVLLNDSAMLFSTDTMDIYSPVTEGIDTFPIDAINGLLDQEFESKCVVSRPAVLAIIDRLSLFVSPYDKKGIYLTFTKDGVMFSSKKSSGTELVPYISSENFHDYTCCIDVEMLRSQVATQDIDTLDISYGSDIAIKMTNNNITQIVALMEDDRIKEA